jgi:hypothetical protein
MWAEGFSELTGAPLPDAAVRWQAKLSRSGCTPDVAPELAEIWLQTDVRGVLPGVQAPTLLIVGDGEGNNVEIAEYVASLMPSATVAVFPRSGWPTRREEIDRDIDPKLEAVQRFIGIEPRRVSLNTVISTVLFTDIVASTEQQSSLGDYAWKGLVERHHAIVRGALENWRGVSRTTPPATASTRRSTAPPAPSTARWRSATACAISTSRFAPACTPANAR